MGKACLSWTAITRTVLAGMLALITLGGAAMAQMRENSAVIIMYHRFGEDQYPSTNVRMEQLDAHLADLTSDRFHVKPVSEIVDAIQAGRVLPDRTIGITIDDAFKSVFENGWPKLKAAGVPVTLFVATGPVDEGQADYMTWDQIRAMHKAGVTIAAHGVHHAHMAGMSPEKAAYEISHSILRIEEEIGEKPTLFAYPYGEAGEALMKQVASTGIKAAFGQHSGAMTLADDQMYLPRFPINERYGEQERFHRVVMSLGLAATDRLPSDPLLGNEEGDNPPAIGFTLPDAMKRKTELACYQSRTGKVENIQRLGPNRVELRFDDPFPAGRTRVNCTVPGPNGRWRWLGMQFFRP
ncbi:polysaccharide deacetylase family protein [Aestuariispira ectoiniformans]|uniref:polysaccharide deacetylase family protein n=1 Tax=Aestuariispira ectoiniformans TaxID=2775080 RepID=UPI00223B1EAE|nr:polysaccharide deacetylase family protein [Aestuariispira ectoiniformans]